MTKLQELEYERLAQEIIRDRDIQFTVFWQSLAATALLLSIVAGAFDLSDWGRFPVILLLPHLVLASACGFILNRAQTANRKSGYVIVSFKEREALSATKPFNWEQSLSIFREYSRAGKNSRAPHRAMTTRHQLLTIGSTELIITFAYMILILMPIDNDSSRLDVFYLLIGAGYIYLYMFILTRRVRDYFCTRYSNSIQGYARDWQLALGLPDSVLEGFTKWESGVWDDVLKGEIRSKPFWSLFLKIYLSSANRPLQGAEPAEAAPEAEDSALESTPAAGALCFDVKNRVVFPRLFGVVMWLIVGWIVYVVIHPSRATHFIPWALLLLWSIVVAWLFLWWQNCRAVGSPTFVGPGEHGRLMASGG